LSRTGRHRTTRGVIEKIRSEGLEIDAKIVVGYQSPKARDWGSRQPRHRA
jgi:hypothetical protein